MFISRNTCCFRVLTPRTFRVKKKTKKLAILLEVILKSLLTYYYALEPV